MNNLPLDKLFCDERYRKPLNERLVEKILDDPNHDLLVKKVVVSEHPNGTFAVLNGAHQIEAMRRLGYKTIRRDRLDIRTGLDLAGEAKVFLEEQTRKSRVSNEGGKA